MSRVFSKVILIDDDDILNYLNKTVIRKFFRPHSIKIVSFDNPEQGFAYLAAGGVGTHETAVLFLDINMPGLSGWQVLDKMSGLDSEIVKPITTYILSSSIDPADHDKAIYHPLVTGFVSKPLSHHLEAIFRQTILQAAN